MTLLRSAPLRARSDKQKAFDGDMRRARSVLMKRSGGACELTGIRDEAIEIHHPYGRHHIGAFTNDPDCLVVVCRSAHRKLTNAETFEGHELRGRAREQVLERLRARLRRLEPTTQVIAADPRREVLLLVEALERAEGEV